MNSTSITDDQHSLNDSPVTALVWVNSLRPALPLSIEHPPTKDNAAQPISNGELKRHTQQGGLLVNGERR